MRPRVQRALAAANARARAHKSYMARRVVAPLYSSDIELLDFIPKLSPAFESPLHLAPMAARITEGIVNGGVRECFHAPVRHGKTELIKHAIVWAMLRNPAIRIMYITYNRKRAYAVSDEIRELAWRAGAPLRKDMKGVSIWKTTHGGMFLPSGTSGAITGFGANLIWVDDPFKDRIEAENASAREKKYKWMKGTAFNRAEPGASIFEIMARWHPDDLTGRLTDPEGPHKWPYLCLPAIGEDNQPLWENRWPLSELEIKRADEGEYNFASLYQGNPIPASGLLFHDAVYTTRIPRADPPRIRVRYAVGVDFTWTSKQRSDYSALVVMARVDVEEGPRSAARTYYVIVDALEMQLRPTAVLNQAGQVSEHGFAFYVKKAARRWQTDAIATHAGSSELNQTVSTVRNSPLEAERLPTLTAYKAKSNKWDRAQKYAAVWNRGEVYVKKGGKWVRSLVSETCGFTGEENAKDNLLDASVSAFQRLQEGFRPISGGRTRMSRR